MKEELNTNQEEQKNPTTEVTSDNIEQQASEDGEKVTIEIETENLDKKGKKKIKKLKEELEQAQKQISTLQIELAESKAIATKASEQYVRLSAEWENFKKRKDREITDSIRFANEDLIKKLLPILDNFDRTLKSIEKTDNLTAVKEGIGIVARSMKSQFEKVGLAPIDSVDQEFDYELHEAITTMPVEEEEKKGKVLDEVEKGYKLKDKVIRFSKVIIGE